MRRALFVIIRSSHSICYGLNIYVHPTPNSNVEALTPNMMVVGDWDFGK